MTLEVHLSWRWCFVHVVIHLIYTQPEDLAHEMIKRWCCKICISVKQFVNKTRQYRLETPTRTMFFSQTSIYISS